RKLEAIAVCVEDVEEAHRAVQLEDDADIDSRPTQLVCDPFHVVDVDVRDAAVLLWLAFGKTDRGSVPLQRRPALFLVRRRLEKAELLDVERARRVEIAHVVPDRRHNASPGSSRNCFTVMRNWAPVAPSTARWSQVSVSSIRGRTCGSPSTATT